MYLSLSTDFCLASVNKTARCRHFSNQFSHDNRSDPGRDLKTVATALCALRQVAPGEYTDVPSTELYSFRSGAARLSASAAPASQLTNSSPPGASSAQAPGTEPDGTVVDAAAFAATASVSEPSADGTQTQIASRSCASC